MSKRRRKRLTPPSEAAPAEKAAPKEAEASQVEAAPPLPPTETEGPSDLLRFLIFSLVGLFVFFFPLTIDGTRTISLDHLVSAIIAAGKGTQYLNFYTIVILTIGALIPFSSGQWRTSWTATIFSCFKVLGLIAGVLAITGGGPSWLQAPNVLPFLYHKLVIKVGFIVPVGAFFLACLVNFGLMEFFGVLMRPIMRPIFKTPGRAAIDAVASFVGSYSLALLITDKVYRQGKYTAREACIIATGFSTVSATFMVVVATQLGLMHQWNGYFWSTLLITFLVTAITLRIPPLSRKSDNRFEEMSAEDEEGKGEGFILTRAYREGVQAAAKAPPFFHCLKSSVFSGFRMVQVILPTILSVGLIGLLLANYTPLFSLLGGLFYPVCYVLRIPESWLAAEACAVSITEMFVPAILVSVAPLMTRYVVGVVSVSSILFFSASIPCIVATKIPITIPELVIIWFERTILSIVLAVPVYWLVMAAP